MASRFVDMLLSRRHTVGQLLAAIQAASNEERRSDRLLPFLLAEHADFDMAEMDTLLGEAVQRADEATFFLKNRKGHSLLHACIKAPNVSPRIVSAVLDKSPVEVAWSSDRAGCTPLHLACKNANLFDIRLLLERLRLTSLTKLAACTAKRNKAGRVPLLELLECQHATFEALAAVVRATPGAVVWTACDKCGATSASKIERFHFNAYILILSSLQDENQFFKPSGVSFLHTVASEWRVASVVEFVLALANTRPSLLRRIILDDASVKGEGRDIFDVFISNERLPHELVRQLLTCLAAHEVPPALLQPRGVLRETLLHTAARRNMNAFLVVQRLACVNGVGVDISLSTTDAVGDTALHILVKGARYDVEARFSALARDVIATGEQPYDVLKKALFIPNLRGKMPFEYATSKTLEVLWPYLSDEAALRRNKMRILRAAVATHNFDIFTKIVANDTTFDPIATDELLHLAASKEDVLLAVRPRRLMEYMLSAIDVVRIHKNTMSRLLSVASRLTGVLAPNAADAALVRTITGVHAKWRVWQRWRTTRIKIRAYFFLAWWEERAMRAKYAPPTVQNGLGGEEYQKSVCDVHNMFYEETTEGCS